MIYYLSDSVEVSMFFLLLVSYMPLDNSAAGISKARHRRSPLPQLLAKTAVGVPSYVTKNSSHVVSPPRQL